MKKIILSIVSLFLLNSCDIDLEPKSSLIYSGYWESEEALEANHSGIYGRFRNYAFTLYSLGELRTDIWGGRTMESPFSEDFIKINYNVDTAPYGNWGNLYRLIHNLNDFIANASKIDYPKNKLNHLYGEVYGIRAYTYFTLLKTWGDVPIVTEPLPPNFKPHELKLRGIKRSSKEEVLNLIKNDLEKSLEYFGDDYTYWNNKKVYWSKNATLALKGDVFLWSGSVLNKGKQEFQTALNSLEQIKNVTLENNFENLWTSANEENNEFIFAFDYQINQATHSYPSFFSGHNSEIRSSFDRFGNSMKSFVSGGLNRFGATEKAVNTFIEAEDNGDLRKKSTFKFLFKNDKGYNSFDDESYKGSLLIKFPGEEIGSEVLGVSNIPVYRYADVVLMIAEAKNELHMDPSAEINLIRQRAYGDKFENFKYLNASYDLNKAAILKERLLEFVGEGKRFWDLVRAGDNELIKNKPEFQGNLYKVYLPITRDMMNNDQFMAQTQGYE